MIDEACFQNDRGGEPMNNLTRRSALRGFAVTGIGLTLPSIIDISHADDLYLVDDLSRSDLALYALLQFDGDRTLPRQFKFPDHVRTGEIWGIDVSHHQGRVDWSDMPDQGVFFAYLKASQGKSFRDREFGRNWLAIKELRSQGKKIHGGAYHFLSAGFSGEEQATNFIDRIGGKLDASDMPACLDLEWDFEVRNGRVIPNDRWGALSSERIVRKALSWLAAVEQATGKRPIIYTNAHWWHERIGNRKDLAGYPIWIADYSKKSLEAEKPREIDGHSWTIWQLTDRGSTSGIGGNVDTNRFSGNEKDFYKAFQIT